VNCTYIRRNYALFNRERGGKIENPEEGVRNMEDGVRDQSLRDRENVNLKTQ
jgi:hypothetical protein